MNPPPEDVIREAMLCFCATRYAPQVRHMKNCPVPASEVALDQLLTELEQVKRDHMSDVRLLQAQLRTAREALEYYALESSWDSPQRDRGAIARQALTHLEGEGL